MFATACEEGGIENGVNGPIVSCDHNKIWYTNGSTSKLTLPSDLSAFGGASIVSNEYDTKKECWVITFDRNVTTIGDEAFDDCRNLTSVTIPDSVTTIESHAFFGCTSLVEVYCKPTTPPSCEYSMFENNASGRKIYVPMESVKAYKSASVWSYYANAIVGYDF